MVESKCTDQGEVWDTSIPRCPCKLGLQAPALKEVLREGTSAQREEGMMKQEVGGKEKMKKKKLDRVHQQKP